MLRYLRASANQVRAMILSEADMLGQLASTAGVALGSRAFAAVDFCGQ
jgi:ABC-type antimicrobial peptide transport system permease subunit